MPPDVENAVETSATETPKFTQFDNWDHDGNPVQTQKPAPKTEETAASATPAKGESEVQKAENAAESETAPKQVRKPGEKLSAGEELAKLRRELREAKAEAESLRGRPRESEPKPSEPKVQAEPESPQNYLDWRKQFNPRKFAEEWFAKNSTASQEDVNAAVTDHMLDVRESFRNAERAREEGMRQFNDASTKARDAYADFDEVVEPAAGKVMELIRDPQVDATLKKALIDADGAHILYALGKDPEIVKKFTTLARTDPAEAIFLWKSLKAQVKLELAKPVDKTTPDTKEPASPKPRAPKPPTEVGGRGAATEDVMTSAAKVGDFRAFEAEQTRRKLASVR
jgi:hypothetical protein